MAGSLFKARQHIDFSSGWQVLMGQAEVVNWLRSTAESVATMRYAGEFKFAGGTVDEGESIAQAGLRELQEEFLIPAGLDTIGSDKLLLRPFIVKQTMPIRSKSNLMYNFVALASENPWLAELDTQHANRTLQQRRERHSEMVAAGDFFELSQAEKEPLAPEVHQLAWVDLHQAFSWALSSMNDEVTHVNGFQQREFATHGIGRRDPMFMTAVTPCMTQIYLHF